MKKNEKEIKRDRLAPLAFALIVRACPFAFVSKGYMDTCGLTKQPESKAWSYCMASGQALKHALPALARSFSCHFARMLLEMGRPGRKASRDKRLRANRYDPGSLEQWRGVCAAGGALRKLLARQGQVDRIIGLS